jgi:RNA-directed DNA polymerase
MSRLAELKAALSLNDIAKLLGFTPKGLSYVLYHLPDAQKYRVFEIPKKHGGFRTIKAPGPQLALAQSRLNELLAACVDELLENNPRFWMASHGFRAKRTIVSNASAHRKRRYVFNVDIADFFGSINFGRVRGFFIKDRAFTLAPPVATIVAQIACHENALPQGSPCSPLISNFVANILDARLMRLAKHAHCTYTRYADDLTFSTNEQIFPSEIAEALAGAEWKVGKRLHEVIEGAGYRLNTDKTRMSLRRSRQSVTGLVVNTKINIRQDYYRVVRAMCDSVFETGMWHKPAPGATTEPEMITSLRPLEGMLSHINFVKARLDRSPKTNKLSAFSPPKAPVELYRRFLFYKHFVANDLPIIVTEGVSDITYLKCAIKSLSAKFPTLAHTANGAPALCFLNPSGTTRTILNLGHGASGQGSLIEQYARLLKHYRHLPLARPVIIMCDNDDGLKQVVRAAPTVIGKSVSSHTTQPFYFLGHNLYLVKVPEGLPPTSRDAEDLFPPAWLAKLLDGKPFAKKGDSTTYGKVIFAEKIVRPNANAIDFTGFEELLQRIAACIVHFTAKSIPVNPSQPATAGTVAPAASTAI